MTNDQKYELCAEAAHELNRVWCKAHGDYSHVIWAVAPAWQKESAIKGVQGAIAGNTPQQSHASWLKEKEETGWKFGPVKDADKKEHPCFVPYDQLPPEQQVKDHIFVNTVKTMWAALEMVG